MSPLDGVVMVAAMEEGTVVETTAEAGVTMVVTSTGTNQTLPYHHAL